MARSSRRRFFRELATSALSVLAVSAAGLTLGRGRARAGAVPLRPPGALPENDFLATCIRCGRCVDACPANALLGAEWLPGVQREKILDVQACDQWKKEHYYQYHKGHNCGICSAVCPYGLNVLKRGKLSEGSLPEQ